MPARFEPRGPLTVSFDGTTCQVTNAESPLAGPYWVTMTNDAPSDLTVAFVTLHPGATWAQLEAYAATYTGEQAAPDFADIGIVPVLGPGIDAVVDLTAGTSGFVCVAVVDGTIAGVTVGASFEVDAP
jgi:hypothetical protein